MSTVTPTARPKVSVVVPVHNPGASMDRCLESLLRQSLPVEAYEIWFVDDGSTDGTGVRLDQLVGQDPRIRVAHLPHSGGPGSPRNHGLARARGEYVYFVDHDDWLGDEALERLYAMARRCDSDIVIGKAIGHGGRGSNKQLFRASRERADIVDDHLLRILTPHKLFRTEFLRGAGLAFPEGRAWLEDHRFVVEAYLRAKVISVLADYGCYHWQKREAGENYSAREWDPRAYYAALEQVLDVVDAHTEPGSRRDRMYLHWYDAKLLRLTGGRTVLDVPVRQTDRRLLAEARRLVGSRFGPELDQLLPAASRVRAALVRVGAAGALMRYRRALQGVGSTPTLQDAEWHDDRLRMSLRAHMHDHEGRPLRLVRDGERVRWDLPVRLGTPLPADALDVTDELKRAQVTVYARHRGSRADFPLPTESRLGLGPDGEIALEATATLDVRTGRLGSQLDDGVWDLVALVECAGLNSLAKLGGVDRKPARRRDVAGRSVVPYRTRTGHFAVSVTGPRDLT